MKSLLKSTFQIHENIKIKKEMLFTISETPAKVLLTVNLMSLLLYSMRIWYPILSFYHLSTLMKVEFCAKVQA